MAAKNYYDILGVKRDATEKEIKQAYRKLARQHHPDVNPGDKKAEAKFKEINEAFEVLSDKDKRQKYNEFGENWQHADQFRQGNAGGGTPFGGGFRQGSATDFQFDGDIGSIFEELFRGPRSGGRTSYRSRAARGRDIEQPVEVTLEEAYHGASRLLNLQVGEPCTACQGSGMIQNVPCSVCRGSGVASRVKRLEVKIPPGVKDGSRVRIAGKGGQGRGGGPNGDLYLVVSVRPQNKFKRIGDDLQVDVPVPLTLAVLGGEVQVPTLKGKLALKIPSETQNGRIFRLKDQGMPHLGKPGHGDLMAKVDIKIPTSLSEAEKDLFRKLREIRPE
jgi:molecular chaperone DnaJ